MQSSNPQAERILMALMVREPHDTIAMLFEKCGEDARAQRLFHEPANQKAFQAILDTFSESPQNFNAASVRVKDNGPVMNEVIGIAESESRFDTEKVLGECISWSSIRAVDDLQREYGAWRRNGVSAEGFREIAARMAGSIRSEFVFANRREKLASETFSEKSEEPFSTGFPLFDQLLKGGWRPGRVNLIAGHTKGGKTVLQANITAWQVLNGNPALVIQREIGAQAYTNLVVSVLSGVEYDRVDSKKDLNEIELERIREALDLLDSYMRVEDSLYTVSAISAWVGLKKEEFEGNPRILVQCDHLNLLKTSNPKSGAPVGMVMEEIAYSIHDMAHPGHGLCVPVVLTAQLEDAAARILVAKGRLSREQFMVRGSRAIEHAVDSAWALGRDPHQVSSAILQKIIDRWGSGEDCNPVSVLYNHKTRSFVVPR